MKTFVVSNQLPGKLAIATRPRGNDWLETDILLFKRGGWHVLVSALEQEEERELGLSGETAKLTDLGLEHIAFPIPDRGTPGVVRAMELADRLKNELQKGRNVAVHCRAGIGRSSLICAAVMVVNGTKSDETWPVLTNARGTIVPDTDEQRRWLDVFARAHAARQR